MRVFADFEAGRLFTELLLHSFDRAAERLAGAVNDVAMTRTTEFPLERIAVPTLVVHGIRDRPVLFARRGKVLGGRIPGAELVAVEGGEHVAIFIHRDVIRPLVAKFLRENAAS